MQETPPIYEIRFQPTYAVVYKQRQPLQFKYSNSALLNQVQKSTAQIENEKNLEKNTHSGYLSDKATKKLKNAINWLVHSAKNNLIKNEKTGKRFTHRISFITLTLPFKQGDLSDQKIKSLLLNPFLTLLRVKYQMNSYVWKAEAQENGNIHFHITTDVYIPHEELRFLWNRLILKKGLMAGYSDKFSKMNYEEFKNYSKSQSKVSDQVILKRYLYGKSTNWENPNSTDIKNVKKAKDLAAYLATYMGKKDSEKRPISGRIWGCSYNLSDAHKCVIEFTVHEEREYFRNFDKIVDKVFFVETEKDEFGKTIHLATIFYYNIKKILKAGDSFFRDKLLEHLKNIRDYGKQENVLMNL